MCVCDAVFLFCVCECFVLSIYEPHSRFFLTHTTTHTHAIDKTMTITYHISFTHRAVSSPNWPIHFFFGFERGKRERESREWNENCFVN